MAKRKQRNYRAEQAHKRNLEQAELRRKKKQQKEFLVYSALVKFAKMQEKWVEKI